MWQKKLNKFIFNFFYQRRYTSFEYFLIGGVIIAEINGWGFWALLIFILGMFGSAVFQVLAEGAKKYGI